MIQVKPNFKSRETFQRRRCFVTYTVGEMAKLLGLPPSTLRYYDKEGLSPLLRGRPVACGFSTTRTMHGCRPSAA